MSSVLRRHRLEYAFLQCCQNVIAQPRRCSRTYIALTPSQVASLLRINETTLDGRTRGKFPVRAFDSNQLASNSPIEDRRAVSRILSNNASIFGVFDGHAGPACAQAVSERLFDYVAVSLMSDKELEVFSRELREGKARPLLQPYSFLNHYFAQDLANVYRNSLQKFANETLSTSGLEDADHSLSEKLVRAIRQLDHDISAEALPVVGSVNYDAIEIALSGACATVVFVEDYDLHIANIGDCRAVLGQQTPDGEWIAKPLTKDHNVENDDEVERLKARHPLNEHTNILKHGRLLGQLYPLRAFGDMRYKWQLNDLKKVVAALGGGHYNQTIIPPHYYTPPYLTAKPEMFHYTLDPRDRFIVLATDGLWENLDNEQVVKLVGDHMESISTQSRFYLDVTMGLGAVNRALKKRKPGLAHKPIDVNGATHLIRHALGPEHSEISKLLTLHQDHVRHYRDDITVIVIYLDELFLENSDHF